MKPDDIARAAEAFQDVIPTWEEYGVSNEDAAKGIVAALQELGLIDATSVQSVMNAWAARDALRAAARECDREARRAAMTPEERKLADMLEASRKATTRIMMDSMLNMAFDNIPALYNQMVDFPKNTTLSKIAFVPEVGPGTMKFETYTLKADVGTEEA